MQRFVLDRLYIRLYTKVPSRARRAQLRPTFAARHVGPPPPRRRVTGVVLRYQTLSARQGE
eukprot:scaffold30453_cov45-Phaeocystis_antarctica.AAC.3